MMRPLLPARRKVADRSVRFTVLCRSMSRSRRRSGGGVERLYVDFEDIRRYRDAVALARAFRPKHATVVAAAGVPRHAADSEGGGAGVLQAHRECRAGRCAHPQPRRDRLFRTTPLRRVGDFSLNAANPLTAQHFITKGLERVTVSYDLNIAQVLDLLAAAPPEWFELTLHQHMPMFHMEHCVFARS